MASVGVKESTIAWVSLLEAVRRKDIYVMLILSTIIIVVTGIFNVFGVPELQKFMTDVSLSIINIFTVIVTVLISARQMPYELEHRTLYPMLAKPVGRWQFLLGKFLGVMEMSTIALLMFFFVGGAAFILFKVPLHTTFFQCIYLRWLSLFVIASITLFLSLMLTHAANVTISLLICFGAASFTRTITIVHDSLDPWQQKIVMAAYWTLPHLDLFDLSKRVVHGWTSAPPLALIYITIYAMIYTFLFLGFACLRFRRQAL